MFHNRYHTSRFLVEETTDIFSLLGNLNAQLEAAFHVWSLRCCALKNGMGPMVTRILEELPSTSFPAFIFTFNL